MGQLPGLPTKEKGESDVCPYAGVQSEVGKERGVHQDGQERGSTYSEEADRLPGNPALFPGNQEWKCVNITLWAEKRDAERYEREAFPKVQEILQPYLTTPPTWKLYTVETTLCEHFVNALTV